MLLKECRRCGRLIKYGSTYCGTCLPIVDKERQDRRKENLKDINRRYNKTRDPKYIRFYNSSDWKTLSAKRLQDDKYKCQFCGAYASEVDHIKAIQTPEGWEHRLDYENTRSLCLNCHNLRHNRFIKRRSTSE